MSDISNSAQRATDNRTQLALGVGAVVAAAASGLWAWITATTGAEVGIAVWLVGLVVGIAVLVAGRGGSLARGLGAAGLTLLGIAAGTLVIAQFGPQEAAAERIADDEHLLAEAVLHDMVANDELDADVVAFHEADDDERAADDELTRKLLAAEATVSGRAHRMSPDQKQKVAAAFAEHRIAQLSWHERAGLSPLSLLWIVLASATAFGVCAPHRGSPSRKSGVAAPDGPSPDQEQR